MKRDEIKTKFHAILLQWLEAEGDGWKLLDKGMEAAGLSIVDAGEVSSTGGCTCESLVVTEVGLAKVTEERDKNSDCLARANDQLAKSATELLRRASRIATLEAELAEYEAQGGAVSMLECPAHKAYYDPKHGCVQCVKAELDRVKGERDRLDLALYEERQFLIDQQGENQTLTTERYELREALSKIASTGCHTNVCTNSELKCCGCIAYAALNPTTETMADRDPDRFNVHPGQSGEEE